MNPCPPVRHAGWSFPRQPHERCSDTSPVGENQWRTLRCSLSFRRGPTKEAAAHAAADGYRDITSVCCHEKHMSAGGDNRSSTHWLVPHRLTQTEGVCVQCVNEYASVCVCVCVYMWPKEAFNLSWLLAAFPDWKWITLCKKMGKQLISFSIILNIESHMITSSVPTSSCWSCGNIIISCLITCIEVVSWHIILNINTLLHSIQFNNCGF